MGTAGTIPDHGLDSSLSWQHTFAVFIAVLGWIVIFAAFVAGITLGVQTEELGRYSTENRHPYLGAAIGIGVGGLVHGALMVLLGVWGSAWARMQRRALMA